MQRKKITDRTALFLDINLYVWQILILTSIITITTKASLWQ